MKECCEVCQHGKDTKGNKVECDIDDKKHDKNYRCNYFKHLLW